jgi:hypothetical protein
MNPSQPDEAANAVGKQKLESLAQSGQDLYLELDLDHARVTFVGRLARESDQIYSFKPLQPGSFYGVHFNVQRFQILDQGIHGVLLYVPQQSSIGPIYSQMEPGQSLQIRTQPVY